MGRGDIMDKWTALIAKLRWVILVAWFAMASLSFVALPDLQAIIRKTEQKFLPTNAESIHATRLLQQINPSALSLSNAVIVLSREEGLRETDLSWMNGLLTTIESRKAELGITSLLSTNTQPELTERLQSKDTTTLLAVVNLPQADFQDETKKTLNQLNALLAKAPDGTLAVLTGSAPLSQDFQHTSQSGLRRTEMLTIGLVLIILIFVFRSPITPLVPLITISISLIISRGLIAGFASFGMPVSPFTESFLIAVLFGAGTDYCILMIQRYREELAKGEDDNRVSAMSRMMNGVGKTIIYSASTVFAAFLLIGFAQFGLYRSAVGVAIGILVTIAASITLAPALLILFGKAIFWPLHQVNSKEEPHKSRIRGAFAPLAEKRSGIVLLAAILILTPLILLFHGQRSYNDISEIDPELGSIVGFHQVEGAFGPGVVFPLTIAIISSQSMRTPTGLAALEQVSAALTRVEGVQEVRSAVRPLGRKPVELTVPGQLKSNNPNVASLIQSIMNKQQALTEGLKALALGAAPLSQGLIGILPAAKQLESSLRQIISSLSLRPSRESHSVGVSKEDSANDSKGTTVNQQALDFYVSPDGRTTKFELILEPHPYSTEAMDTVDVIMEKLRDSLNTTALTNPQAYATGVTAKYNELRDISYRDFVRTAIFVLAGIAIVLMLLLRSILPPLYVLASLGFNYLITMGITEFLFVRILGYSGLSWTVSFFIFLIIVALGVDYSIFLMGRFKEEYRSGEVASAMGKAMRTTGGVIGSAAVIMAGTFGALGFSGVDTLVQIGVGTLIGLLLYATLFMALIVPAFTFLLGEANWWPYNKRRVRPPQENQISE
jgi:RND superfamily putative drug exporter